MLDVAFLISLLEGFEASTAESLIDNNTAWLRHYYAAQAYHIMLLLSQWYLIYFDFRLMALHATIHKKQLPANATAELPSTTAYRTDIIIFYIWYV